MVDKWEAKRLIIEVFVDFTLRFAGYILVAWLSQTSIKSRIQAFE
jgi:hypothetical protein